jgi:hypothetical protein
MTSAPAYCAYGGSVYQSDGWNYTQFPSSLLGKTTWSPGFQHFIQALVTCFASQLKTQVKRRKIREIMADQAEDPELKERYAKLSLRTITSWFAKAVSELEMITRRRLETSNDWENEFTKPFLAKLDPRAAAPASTNAEATTAGAQNVPARDLEYAKYMVSFCRERGWNLVANDDAKLDLVPIPGRELEDIPADHKRVIFDRYREAILIVLKRLRQRE